MISRKKRKIVQDHILSFVPDVPGQTREESFVRQILLVYYRNEGNGVTDRILGWLGIDLNTFSDAVQEWVDQGNMLSPGDEVCDFLELVGKNERDPVKAWNVYENMVVKVGTQMFANLRTNTNPVVAEPTNVILTYNPTTPSKSVRSGTSDGGSDRGTSKNNGLHHYFTDALVSDVKARNPQEAARTMIEYLAPRGVDSLLMWSNAAEYSVVYTKDYGWAIARDGVEDYKPLFSDGGPVPNRYAPRDMPKGSRYRALNRGNVR